ncbi:DUF3800 domain-containing protein [uncultured Adlercreutzia sp.]|uniref:DUF3800 domain-containing protein n=1 Tax=uncultured Adlercreutzia sp. TaxID=875803 RepID=UPI0025D0CA5C|nr:DUF3800 domain-containing protein [uncultured Adlercreutzia sp.]
MGELSVFVDESGDFGSLSSHSPYYIVSLVLHNQAASIVDQIGKFNERMRREGWDGYGPVHTAPLIRREYPYAFLDGAKRRRIFDALFAFARRCDISHASIIVDKRWFGSGTALEERVARELGLFVRGNIERLQAYDKVVVYYDKGQKEVSRTLRVAFSASLSNVEHRVVSPEDYLLFQVADLCCTMELVERRRREGGLTKSESAFFGGSSSFKKTYYKEFARQAY